MHHGSSRREFIKNTVGLSVALGLTVPNALPAQVPDKARGLPCGTLGRTGERIPRLVFGLGSRFCAIRSVEESDHILNRALEQGLFYWDTAALYTDAKSGVVSEERVGRVLSKHRKEVFISTKVAERDVDAAQRQIETSLKRLRISSLDQLMVHSVTSTDDAAKVLKKGGVADLLYRLKEQGICKYVGFTGHSSAAALKVLVDQGNFDTLLMALNHYGNGKERRQEMVLPAAKAKGMGVLVMKAIRPREKDPSLKPDELIRYALSLPHPDAVVVGMDSLKVLESNLALLRGFQPLPEADMKRLAAAWNHLDSSGSLPWMEAGYCDGNWA